MLSALLSSHTLAQSHIEIFTGLQQLTISTTQNGGVGIKDKPSSVTAGIGAYREHKENVAYGFVVEISQPYSRKDLPGNGKVVGVRPINYLKTYSKHWKHEIYGGFAQYQWEKSAAGYYVGSNIRYSLASTTLSIVLDIKYYQDLSYDAKPDDLIAQGFNTGLFLSYHF